MCTCIVEQVERCVLYILKEKGSACPFSCCDLGSAPVAHAVEES